MPAFIFGDTSDLIKDFFLILLSGMFPGAIVYAVCAYPQLRKRNLRNTQSYKKLGMFLWGGIMVISVITGFWICSHRFTAIETWGSEVVLQYCWPSRKVHVKCQDLNYIEPVSHPKYNTRQLMVFTRDRIQYKSRKISKQEFEPLYKEIQKAVCKNE
ncbi:MAG: hypothetical protein JEZ02_21040 [Desulfatibacillum sp.]|nr:hypothetical protein [Desulfatibacillum sp.]